jgi:adenylate cyclase
LAVASVLYWRNGRQDSLAVLPFIYTSADAGAADDPEREYLSDGLTESIIRDLSRLSGLRVIARSSVFRYKGRESDPREVGHALNVRTVLTGRIAQRGDRLTVSAELVEAATGTRLWGDRFEAGVADLMRVQDEIAGHIAGELSLRLTEGERRQQLARQHTPDPEAHRLYLKGLYFWNRRTAVDAQKAVEH